MEQAGLSGLEPEQTDKAVITFALLGFNLKARARIKKLAPFESLVLEGRCLGIGVMQRFDFLKKKKGTLMVFKEELNGWLLALFALFTDLKAQGKLNQDWMASLAEQAERPMQSP
jgi:hypothetical protein